MRSAFAAGVATVAACVAMPDGDDAAAPARASGPIVLTGAGAQSGIPENHTPCVVFDDFDGDGRPDLLLDRSDTPMDGVVDLYRNRGDGTFSQVPLAIPAHRATSSCDAADIDGDGDLDLAIGLYTPGVVLLVNDGDLRFHDAPELAPDVRPESDANLTWLGFLHADRDGWPDLLVTYFGNPPAPIDIRCDATPCDLQCSETPRFQSSAPRLFRNLAGRGFSRVAGGPSAGVPRDCNAVGIFDWDGDGLADVFYAIDFGVNAFYRNPGGDDPWTDWLPAWGANPYNHAMGVAFGDFDRDGRWDLYVTDAGPEQLWYGRPDGGVTDRTAALGLCAPTSRKSGWSPVADDFNQDGWLDVFDIASGTAPTNALFEHVMQYRPLDAPYPQQDLLFTGGAGGFSLAPIAHEPVSYASPGSGAAAVADFDGDGDLDIAEAYMAPMKFRLLRNDSAGGHYLTVRLRGRAPDTDGTGAWVSIEADGAVLARRYVVRSTGSVGRSWAAAHFGLGARAAVDAIEVRWLDGAVQRQEGPIGTGQVVTIEER